MLLMRSLVRPHIICLSVRPAVRKRASMAVLDSPVKPWNDKSDLSD